MPTVALTTAKADDNPQFTSARKLENERAEVKVEKDRVVLSAHGPTEISNAVIERVGEKWPGLGSCWLRIAATKNQLNIDLRVLDNTGKF